MMKKDHMDIFTMCLVAAVTVLVLAVITNYFVMYLISFISFLGLSIWWMYSIFTYNPEEDEEKKDH